MVEGVEVEKEEKEKRKREDKAYEEGKPVREKRYSLISGRIAAVV